MVKVLVADNDESSREELRHWLEAEGHNVECVVTGRDAVTSFDQKQFGIVILEWTMPGMTGFDALMKMRMSERRYSKEGSARIFIMTSQQKESFRFMAYLGQADGFMFKPLKKESMIKMISEN